MSESKTRQIDSYLWSLALFLGLILLLAGGYFLWSRYNPFFDQTPEFKEAAAVQSAVRRRALTADEFAECLRLCESGELTVRLSAFASLEAAVKRSPEYIPQAVEVLKRVAVGKDAQASASATAVLKRLTDPPAR
jgi:hypothetical protein